MQGATFAGSPPPSFGISMGGLEIEGRPKRADSLKTFGFNDVSPDFFGMLGLPITQGRTFTPRSGVTDRPADDEVIINEALAARFWPGGNALGARVRRPGIQQWATVVGIATDVRVPAAETYNRDLQMYMLAPAAPRGGVSLVIRSTLPLAALRPAIERIVHDADPSMTVNEMHTANDMIVESMEGQRFVLELLGAFAILAVVLAGVGLHGVIAYSVGQRTREIGVRVALGALSNDVARMVMRQGLRLAITGAVIGSIAALGLTRALTRFLYGVAPGDPLTLAAVALVALAIAVVASYAPARRAARLDPVAALRAD